jgi:hypothetical protein
MAIRRTNRRAQADRARRTKTGRTAGLRGSKPMTVTRIDEPTSSEVARLDRIAKSREEITTDEIREIARVVAILARGQDEIAQFLKDKFNTKDAVVRTAKR